MGNLTKCHTVKVAIGQVYLTSPGLREMDVLYLGTIDAVTLTGNLDLSGSPSVPIPIPPSMPYHLPFNSNGYDPLTITNNGDAEVSINEYF